LVRYAEYATLEPHRLRQVVSHLRHVLLCRRCGGELKAGDRVVRLRALSGVRYYHARCYEELLL
jgi:hypothetical protein